ncbi:unnamed protein product [Mycena citricolor]|uniref:Uncharacterized protein n=1 Tax=Mycena citricolor TaxID=2018698 RepID=A0AAD2Q788_9AGAR|nr:unnamed protein product [Mycena citricolor]
MSLSPTPSLLTPPHTAHREKENRVATLGRFHVYWSSQDQVRTINNSIPTTPTKRELRRLPSKSILKKCPQSALPLFDTFQRETTPEPSQPASDSNYLSSPVNTIIDPSASIEHLIRAYSVLTARVKAHVTLTADRDAPWPILAPLRQNRVMLEKSIIRDLARCLVDPQSMPQTAEDVEEEESLRQENREERDIQSLLPSPKRSPTKKRRGTTAKKAKYGRDLCTVCHSVMKLLTTLFTLPAAYNVFNVCPVS